MVWPSTESKLSGAGYLVNQSPQGLHGHTCSRAPGAALLLAAPIKAEQPRSRSWRKVMPRGHPVVTSPLLLELGMAKGKSHED
jgi:hypothetical protein